MAVRNEENPTTPPAAHTAVPSKGADLTTRGSTDELEPNNITYLNGLHFWAVTTLCVAVSAIHVSYSSWTFYTDTRTTQRLCINFFMVSVEISVVSTALVGITDELGGLDHSSWIMSSYLLGYVAVVIIFAKLSDIFGRKQMMIFCLLIFTVFSAVCGSISSVVQLIIFRAFQGIGGGGCFAMNMVFIAEVVPPHRYGQFAALLGIPAALSMGLGPILGGAISSNTSWRWVFFMNLPAAAVALALSVFAVPNGFPYHGNSTSQFHGLKTLVSKSTWGRVDTLGSVLLFLSTLSVTAGLEEAGSRFPWRSGYVISLLTTSGIFWIALLVWERRVSLASNSREPVLPWRFITDRVLVGILLASFLLGGPWTVSLFVLPLRFQLVNGLSSLDAGIRMLPFALATPCAAVLGGMLGDKLRLPPVFYGLVGATLQATGFGLLTLAGFGCGAVYQTVVILVPLAAGRKDSAVGMGAVTQFRMMGGAVILSIATSVFKMHVEPRLKGLGLGSLEGLAQLDGLNAAREVRSILSDGFNRQMFTLCISGVAEVPALLLLWKRQQIVLPQRK